MSAPPRCSGRPCAAQTSGAAGRPGAGRSLRVVRAGEGGERAHHDLRHTAATWSSGAGTHPGEREDSGTETNLDGLGGLPLVAALLLRLGDRQRFRAGTRWVSALVTGCAPRWVVLKPAQAVDDLDSPGSAGNTAFGVAS